MQLSSLQACLACLPPLSAQAAEAAGALLLRFCPLPPRCRQKDPRHLRRERQRLGAARPSGCTVLTFAWLLCTPTVGAVQIWQHGVMAGQPVFTTGGVPAAHSPSELGPVQSPDTPFTSPLAYRNAYPLRTVGVFQPDCPVQPTILHADVRMQGPLFELMLCRALGLQRSEWHVRRLSSSLPSLPTEQYVLSPMSQAWFSVHVPVSMGAKWGCGGSCGS